MNRHALGDRDPGFAKSIPDRSRRGVIGVIAFRWVTG
jgi:hypothetical protein